MIAAEAFRKFGYANRFEPTCFLLISVQFAIMCVSLTDKPESLVWSPQTELKKLRAHTHCSTRSPLRS